MSTVSDIVSDIVSPVVSSIMGALFGTWFDGSDDVIAISSTDFGNTDTLSFRGQSNGGSCHFVSGAGGAYRIFLDVSDVFSVRINNDGTFAWDLSSFTLDEERAYVIVRDGTAATLFIDGVSQGEVTGGDSSSLPITQFGNRIGYASGVDPLTGVIHSIELKNSSNTVLNSWAGNDNTTAAWADPDGAKNGTVTGSPAQATKSGSTWTSV